MPSSAQLGATPFYSAHIRTTTDLPSFLYRSSQQILYLPESEQDNIRGTIYTGADFRRPRRGRSPATVRLHLFAEKLAAPKTSCA